jgi:hypothetical protein
MDSEYFSLMKNKTWDLVDLLPSRKPINCKWIFILKYKLDGSIECNKAKLLTKGYSQVPGVDYSDTFLPVVKFTSICLLLA